MSASASSARCPCALIDAATGDAYGCTLGAGHEGLHRFDTTPAGSDALRRLLDDAEQRLDGYGAACAEQETRADALEADLASLRARVEALAGEFRRRENVDRCLDGDYREGTALAYGAAADALTALLPGGDDANPNSKET